MTKSGGIDRLPVTIWKTPSSPWIGLYIYILVGGLEHVFFNIFSDFSY